ncbi:MAG: dihydrolipoyl dehydrogenase [Candidatus Latescibacteria bacterium]|nr:dihydrolipoyl dehydrogenase [Candidatus Latescibacterota bacterium]
MSEPKHVAVIGGGPGGYAAAFMAADLGMKVTLIDPEINPGGVCLYRGCIPSKALLHVAKVINETREAAAWGVSYGEPEIDIDKVRKWKDGVVSRLTKGLGDLSKKRNVDLIQGRARFSGPNSLNIESIEGETKSLSFDNAILATGSRPVMIPSLYIDSPRFMDSTGALALESIPKTLLVIGGGYIGLELGTVYAALGTKVTVVEMTPNLLPGADANLVGVLAKSVREQMAEVLLNTSVTGLVKARGGIRASFEGKDAEKREQTFEKVLMAVGRVPNTRDLGLENTGVALTEKGFIQVDAQRRTTDQAIYAIGDISGDPMLAHKASHEGIVAAESIGGAKVAFEPAAIPAVVFTDPELAWCGLTETQAKSEGREVKVARFPWAASGRAMTLDRQEGLTKLIVDPETDRILGVGIVGPGAGELIAEGTLAVEMAALASDLQLTIHPHPTLSETMMEAAESYYGFSTHIYSPKRK